MTKSAEIAQFVRNIDADRYIQIPVVTTTERNSISASPGMLIYNSTTGTLQQYTGNNAWQSIDSPPIITSLSYAGSTLAADPAGGETITIYGANFTTNPTVTIDGNLAASVTRISSTEIQFTTIAKSPGDYDVTVTNTTGLGATLTSGISYNGTPAFTTPAGKVGNDLYPDTAIPTITIVAAEPDGGAVSYSITSGTSLPAGLSLNSSGEITGTAPDPVNTTTYNFSVTATDDENQTNSRAFNLVVLRKIYTTPINYSAKFDKGSNTYLQRTSTATGNNQKFTLSFWMKPTDMKNTIQEDAYIVSYGGTGNPAIGLLWKTYDYSYTLTATGPSQGTAFVTTQRFRDVSQWVHVVYSMDVTQASASERLKLYINGERVTNFSAFSPPPQNWTGATINTNGNVFSIGRLEGIGRYFGGYLADFHYVDGTEYQPTAFAENYRGVWAPKPFSGTYGTNGFYLNFGGNIGYDQSGNGNNFVASNFNLGADFSMLDTPTNNFCTFNNLDVQTYGTVRDGGLLLNSTNNSRSTFSVNSGKWYAEISPTVTPGGAVNHVGFGRTDVEISHSGWDTGAFAFWREDGIRQYNGNPTSGLTTYTAGDIIGLAIDFDAGTMTWYKNGSAVTNFTNLSIPSSWSGKDIAFMSRPNPGGCETMANFGQDSSFGGRQTAQNNTDANGIGDFYYVPPTGHLAMCSANLATPALDPIIDEKPEDNFKVATWTGNGASSQQVTVGFEPDLMIVKDTNVGYHWRIFDRVRGFDNPLHPNNTAVIGTYADYGYPLSTDSTSMTVGQGTDSNNLINGNGTTFVGYCFKLGGAAVTNNDGDITSQVSANPDIGVSVVQYTGSGNNGATYGHGLNQAPELIITKGHTTSYNWNVCTSLFPNHYLELNTTAAKNNNSTRYVTGGTSTNSMTNYVQFNQSGIVHTAYCFHSVEGFSKIGRYVGSVLGTNDGSFVNTGFKPAFVMVKWTGTDVNSNWTVWDNTRPGYNAGDPKSYRMEMDTNNVQDGDNRTSNGNGIDFLSNGFKLRAASWYDSNFSGGEYLYVAFAESPFKYNTGE